MREAGGFVSDIEGKDNAVAKGQVVAGNDTMHRALLKLLKEAAVEAGKDAMREANKEASVP